MAARQFKTLASMLTKAGLVKTLQGKGPFTVFAPTDAAFAKVPNATLAKLGADPMLLKQVLLYHVVSGKVPAATVVTLNGKAAKTVNGASVKITVKSGKGLPQRLDPRHEDQRDGLERDHPRDQQSAAASDQLDKRPSRIEAARVPPTKARVAPSFVVPTATAMPPDSTIAPAVVQSARLPVSRARATLRSRAWATESPRRGCVPSSAAMEESERDDQADLDTATVARVAGGDAVALRELYDRYGLFVRLSVDG